MNMITETAILPFRIIDAFEDEFIQNLHVETGEEDVELKLSLFHRSETQIDRVREVVNLSSQDHTKTRILSAAEFAVQAMGLVVAGSYVDEIDKYAIGITPKALMTNVMRLTNLQPMRFLADVGGINYLLAPENHFHFIKPNELSDAHLKVASGLDVLAVSILDGKLIFTEGRPCHEGVTNVKGEFFMLVARGENKENPTLFDFVAVDKQPTSVPGTTGQSMIAVPLDSTEYAIMNSFPNQLEVMVKSFETLDTVMAEDEEEASETRYLKVADNFNLGQNIDEMNLMNFHEMIHESSHEKNHIGIWSLTPDGELSSEDCATYQRDVASNDGISIDYIIAQPENLPSCKIIPVQQGVVRQSDDDENDVPESNPFILKQIEIETDSGSVQYWNFNLQKNGTYCFKNTVNNNAKLAMEKIDLSKTTLLFGPLSSSDKRRVSDNYEGSYGISIHLGKPEEKVEEKEYTEQSVDEPSTKTEEITQEPKETSSVEKETPTAPEPRSPIQSVQSLKPKKVTPQIQEGDTPKEEDGTSSSKTDQGNFITNNKGLTASAIVLALGASLYAYNNKADSKPTTNPINTKPRKTKPLKTKSTNPKRQRSRTMKGRGL